MINIKSPAHAARRVVATHRIDNVNTIVNNGINKYLSRGEMSSMLLFGSGAGVQPAHSCKQIELNIVM